MGGVDDNLGKFWMKILLESQCANGHKELKWGRQNQLYKPMEKKTGWEYFFSQPIDILA